MPPVPSPFRALSVALLALALAPAGCDDYPKDPSGTLDRVRGGTLRVGLLMHPPWVDLSGPAPSGVEVALAEALAAELDARLQWIPAGEAEVLEALEDREIDLVLGGLTERSPWRTRVAFTRPYYETALVVAGPLPGSLPSLDEVPVAVDPGTTEPALVDGKGGVPVPEPVAGDETELRAMPHWRVPPGETAVFTLHTDRHVAAVPKGENAWLITVDRFLRERAPRVDRALRDAR